MKRIAILKYFLQVFLSMSLLSACNYLEVIPPEQANLDDTMKDANAVRNFLYSCYNGVENTITMDNPSVDETTNSIELNSGLQRLSYNQLSSSAKDYGCWDNAYNAIGQCHLFLQQLEKSNPLGVDEAMKTQYRAEVNFLIAYYHFRLLVDYGPIPIIDHFMSMATPVSEIPGRSHFDYVVDFICKKCDEAATDLPAYRTTSEWGRATSSICYALKARLLLYAASDLWNGSFPYKDWKNKNYETPGYGKELVSNSYEPEKWRRALEACDYALKWAEDNGGNKLLLVDNMPSRVANLKDPYIPENSDEDFVAHVKLMSLVLQSTPDEGNFEYLWGIVPYIAIGFWSPLPLNIIERNGSWVSGYSQMAPTLYTIEHFCTKNGKLPENDEKFVDKSDWLKSAGVSGRSDIINLCVGREPRFYAWMAFDGGEYTQQLVNGKSLQLNMKSSSKQGRSPQVNRNYSPTGFLSKKFVEPDLNFTSESSGEGNNVNYPIPLFRLAELYLNRAECYAALDMTKEALADINTIRRRAGVLELKESDLDVMPLMDWIRNERFVELWGEGHRYYDVRRWMIAPERLKAGAREGLNVLAKYDPSFDEFNVRTRINQPFMWDNRMYILPVYADEVYSNPQMIQAPGY